MQYIIESVINGYVVTVAPLSYDNEEDNLSKLVFEQKDVVEVWSDRNSVVELQTIRDNEEQQQRALQEVFQFIAMEENINNKHSNTELVINIMKKSLDDGN